MKNWKLFHSPSLSSAEVQGVEEYIYRGRCGMEMPVQTGSGMVQQKAKRHHGGSQAGRQGLIWGKREETSLSGGRVACWETGSLLG